ncbi:MAG: D-TA family PLP-dependent enzyme [Spirochaetia bacterium]|nr:D-TA family PLP-dependent enzyme [Spirochaetia bacterium]
MKYENLYTINNTQAIETPALIYHRDIILENTKKVIEIAKEAKRLWPHIKTHKMREMITMQMDLGIERFKCSTIAEAELLARVGAKHALLAYPIIGPNINRFIRLQKAFEHTKFWAISDNGEQMSLLASQAHEQGISIPLLIDVNFGMNRTGIHLGQEIKELVLKGMKLKGVEIMGFHCYDGHHHDYDFKERTEKAHKQTSIMFSIAESISAEVEDFSPIFIMGGTPSFPSHALTPGVFLSPGTAFAYDYGYSEKVPDLPFVPGATILTRVISHPAPHLFTLDLGHKGIATDRAGLRGLIIGIEDATPIIHSEEHWVFSRDESYPIPPIGSIFHVIPSHICPTTALYPSVLVAEKGEIVGSWDVAARNRHLNF